MSCRVPRAAVLPSWSKTWSSREEGAAGSTMTPAELPPVRFSERNRERSADREKYDGDQLEQVRILGRIVRVTKAPPILIPKKNSVAMTAFAEKYAPKYDKAVDCLLRDRDALLTFFDFPAEHWTHLRTSNPIESAFATVRHRTVRMKGALSRDTARLMVFKLIMAAAKSWRRLQGQNQLPKIVRGVKFRDGIGIANQEMSAA